MQLLTIRNSNTQNPLQDLRYTYDPVGNIVEIYDASKETSYYKNSVIEPRHLFTYDALYRLLSGTGRELLGLAQATSGGYAANSAGAADAKALHTYTQQFAYDELGNIKSIQHQTNTSSLNWTRNYVYDGATNRLLKHDDNQTLPDYTYDEHGNMLKMPHLQSMHYDYKDQLDSVMLDASENMAYYVYDANGQRVRKVVVKGNVREERIYVGSYEVFRKYENSVVDLERSSVHIMDDKNRVAIVEKLKINEGKAVTVSENCRYQYSNHLGSASLELNATGQIISYEEFHPFGTTSYRSGTNDTEVSLKRYKYIGKERDEETGLYYYGFRYYAPWIARFINVDPLQHEYPHYTPFQYAGNKPITYVDLDGLEEGIKDEELNTRNSINSYDNIYYKKFEENWIKALRKYNYVTTESSSSAGNLLQQMMDNKVEQLLSDGYLKASNGKIYKTNRIVYHIDREGNVIKRGANFGFRQNGNKITTKGVKFEKASINFVKKTGKALSNFGSYFSIADFAYTTYSGGNPISSISPIGLIGDDILEEIDDNQKSYDIRDLNKSISEGYDSVVKLLKRNYGLRNTFQLFKVNKDVFDLLKSNPVNNIDDFNELIEDSRKANNSIESNEKPTYHVLIEMVDESVNMKAFFINTKNN